MPPAFQFSEIEYAYSMDPGASIYKCSDCVKTLLSQKNDDKTVKARSLLTLDLSKKIVSPERALVLPDGFR
jgi:hypothetical protein